MTGLVFVDTNVLIYALDERDPAKRSAAIRWRQALWREGRGRVSFQVLQECYWQLLRIWPDKRKEAQAEVRDLLEWNPLAIDAHLLESAWMLQERYQLSFWDALILAAAKMTGCKYLLTEDLQAGQDLDGVVVVNPFLNPPESLL